MALRLYNTLTRKKETFKPLRGRSIGLYTCGPTVYNYAHIGNLRMYVNEDLLKRYLLWRGFRVNHVMNITDVGHLTDDADEGEDKMVIAERREGKNAWEIAKFYEAAFLNDMNALNVLAPNVLCRATEHIKEQVELVKRLEKKGFTYVIEDGVYFDTSKLKDYGKLAKLRLAELKAGARVEVAEGKRNHTDFALWKISPGVKRHMEWNSPWGKGFPGWHIECSAMAMKYLGETFDVHCGGVDHVPVHHTNEIAQSEAATGKRFVKYWWHGEFLNVEGAKMAKSAGNFLRLASVSDQGVTPRQLRFFYLSAHYRTQQLFTWESLNAAAQTLNKLDGFIDRLRSYANGTKNSKDANVLIKEMRKRFEETMDDDLNIPQMWAHLHAQISAANRLMDGHVLSTKDAKKTLDTLMELDEVLGVFKKPEHKVPAEVKKLIAEREIVRKNKNFARADEIRKVLLEKHGVEVRDTPEGPKVKFV